MKPKKIMLVTTAILLILLAGNAFAGSHCFDSLQGSWDIKYTLDFTNLNPDSIVNGSPSHRMIMDGNNYIIPSDTILEINEITQFKNHCVDSHYTMSKPLMRATIIEPDGNITINDNMVQQGMSYCDKALGRMCFGDTEPYFIYRFMKPGTYTVEIEHSLINSCSAPDWVYDDTVAIKVVNPEITINGPQDKVIALSSDKDTTTTFLTWTIQNNSNTELELSDNNMNCKSTEESCKLIGFTHGLKLLPQQTVTMSEQITLTNPVTSPVEKQFSLEIKYQDTNGLARHTMKSNPVKLTAAYEETGKFNVKLFAKEQTECIGANSEIGQTGNDDAPKILLSWDWASIQQNSCDKKTNSADYIYCDPVQFSIELLKKLNAVETLLAGGKNIQSNEITALTSFKAYLIGDNYSDDFRKDFDQYYVQAGFFNADSFYKQSFYKYFLNPASFAFNPQKIDSGLYQVDIDINAGNESSIKSLFGEGMPNAKITIKFTKIKDPLQKNPIYYMPFDGEIGKYGTDSDGTIGRKDYGLKFNGDSIKLDATGATITDSKSGATTVNTYTINSFEKTNLTNRGQLLSLTKNTITISPNRATPVLAKVTATAMRAELFYSLKKESQSFDVGKNYESLWTEIASSTQCTDFLGNQLFDRRQDAKADESNCTTKNGTNQGSYGFEWTGINASKENSELYLQTIFFTPTNENYFLENSCPETKQAQFYAPGTKIATTSMPLDYTKEATDSIQQLVDLVKQGKACTSITNGELKIWWNTQEINKALDNAKQAIQKNMVCTTTG